MPEHAAPSTWRVESGGCSAVAAVLVVAWSLAAIMRFARPNDAEGDRDMTELCISLDVLTSAERRDLANALLRAAWSAVLEETRIVLLDLLLTVDDAIPTEVSADPHV
jgi:hypothetical protein